VVRVAVIRTLFAAAGRDDLLEDGRDLGATGDLVVPQGAMAQARFMWYCSWRSSRTISAWSSVSSWAPMTVSHSARLLAVAELRISAEAGQVPDGVHV